MVRNILLLVLLLGMHSTEARARTADDLPPRPGLPGRTRITVLPPAEDPPQPPLPHSFQVTPGTDLWFPGSREHPEPGASLAWDGFFTPGPLRLSAFFEGGVIFRRESWTEERPFIREIGGEPYTFLSIVRVEKESLVPACSFGLGLSYERVWKDGGFSSFSAGLGGAWIDARWALALRGAVTLGRRDGPYSIGVRLCAAGTWNESFTGRLSMGITGGLEF